MWMVPLRGLGCGLREKKSKLSTRTLQLTTLCSWLWLWCDWWLLVPTILIYLPWWILIQKPSHSEGLLVRVLPLKQEKKWRQKWAPRNGTVDVTNLTMCRSGLWKSFVGRMWESWSFGLEKSFNAGSLMSRSCRHLWDNNAKGNEDRIGLAHEVSEGDKDSVRKWVTENLFNILAKILSSFCSYPKNLGQVELKENWLIFWWQEGLWASLKF